MIIETEPISSEKESLYVLMYNDYFLRVTSHSDFSLSVALDYQFSKEYAEVELKHAQSLLDMIVNQKHWRTKEDIEVYLDVSDDLFDYGLINDDSIKHARIVNINIDTYITRMEID